MSAAVCGSKRSYFFDADAPPTPVSKKLRCRSSSTSPPRCFSPPSYLPHLQIAFPTAQPELLERTLEECGNDLDTTLNSLHKHFEEFNSASSEEVGANADQDVAVSMTSAPNNLPANGAEWVELLVKEMTTASSIDDARARATRVLDSLEKSINAHAAGVATQSYQKETMMLKEQMEVLVRENHILKKAVAIQHERQKDFDDKNRELVHLNQLVSQYQEQLRTLEVNNYALMMHLRQANQSSPIPGRFHPDVF
ncbi:hypothetical protein K2173_019275 [Erythroxylum novogranatense]|uniref:CUE domain-containing protein n=1 Tax=Erythroxylum novogranatense TaxID=1862640 RepID=A0AAV8ST83_9ROSI|nr:hypothetical protein K2173_019275 [Erythroxylum novogranatense]